MSADFDLLSLQRPVGTGQENNPDDVEALDDALRAIRAYEPPPEYADGPQRYATEPMIGALERLQEQHGLKIDGVANPGGPTERAINNRLLRKPSGAGLLYDPPAPIGATVGNGFENRPGDVVSLKRKLGALDYIPEDPFDRPSGFIDEAATNAVKAFQRANGLAEDGWLAPNGETERALDDAIADLKRVNRRDWLDFAERAGGAQAKADDGQVFRGDSVVSDHGFINPLQVLTERDEPNAIEPAFYDPRYGIGDLRPKLEGGWMRIPGGAGGSRSRGSQPPPPPPNVPFGIPMPNNVRPSTEAPSGPTLPQEPSSDSELHIPEPGSLLRIPIIDVHPYGPRGKPETQQTTKDVVDAIEAECKKAFEKTGATFERTYEEYYRGPKGKRGSSFADGLFRITIGDITIDFVADTYTPKGDASPNSAEQRRIMKLEPNMERANVHGIVIRVPKPWALGQVLDTEKLSQATKEICEQTRKMLDSGELDPYKDKKFLEKLRDKLTKAKPKPAPEPSTEP